MIEQHQELEFRSVSEPRAARKLLQRGHAIIDIKPNKENKLATVFIFTNTEKFRSDLRQIKKELNL